MFHSANMKINVNVTDSPMYPLSFPRKVPSYKTAAKSGCGWAGLHWEDYPGATRSTVNTLSAASCSLPPAILSTKNRVEPPPKNDDSNRNRKGWFLPENDPMEPIYLQMQID